MNLNGGEQYWAYTIHALLQPIEVESATATKDHYIDRYTHYLLALHESSGACGLVMLNKRWSGNDEYLEMQRGQARQVAAYTLT